MRGQTFDGAANMAGQLNGVKAMILEQQPLATFIHCSAHCTDLETQVSIIFSSSLVRDALVVLAQSRKLKRYLNLWQLAITRQLVL